MERFFDESGGMQLVIHSPFGIRVNRAWGLALRKRFCRSFNFELQAAATDDAIVLSLGTQHSFPLEEVFRYLNSKTVRDLLVQALLDAPMFPIRWRWNADTRPGPAAAARRTQDARAAATDGIGEPAGRRFSRPARLPGEYRRRPRDSGPSAGAADDRGLPDRGDGHRRPDRPAQTESKAAQVRCLARRFAGAFPVGARDPQRQALRLSRQRAAGGTAHPGGLHPAGRRVIAGRAVLGFWIAPPLKKLRGSLAARDERGRTARGFASGRRA